MSERELASGIVILKELPLPDNGVWPFVVYEVRYERAAPQFSVIRVAYVFPTISQHSDWSFKLFERLQKLSSHPLRCVALEFIGVGGRP